MLSRNETQPSSEISRLAKGFCSTNCGDEGRGVESADAGNRRQALGHFVRVRIPTIPRRDTDMITRIVPI